MKSVIKVTNVDKFFGDYQALHQINLNIPSGRIYGLLGPNGAGKTTLLRLINQISKPDSGELLFNDEPLSALHIRKIGYLPEERGLYRKMKIGDQLIYLSQLKGLTLDEAKEKTNQWLEKFEISDWYNKKIEELSKGMAQKIQFIATVIHDPELVILDEPFSGFDPINSDLIKAEILELKKQKKTIIYSTHNMNSVEEICDHVAVINKGHKILHGKVSTLRQKYATGLYEIIFVGNMISFSTALWADFELVSSQEVAPKTIKAVVKSAGNSVINDLIKVVIQHCNILSVTEKIPTVHEIFVQEINQHNLTINE